MPTSVPAAQPLSSDPPSPPHVSGYDWQRVRELAFRHRRELILANLIAILAAVVSVPIPLLMPLLVDEVLLDKPGITVETINHLFPPAWHGPMLYIGAVLLLTLSLRFISVGLGVFQMRQFTHIAKDITYRIRRDMLLHLQAVSMSAYETLGSGTVASHLVTDVDSIDQFIGSSVSRFLVALLTIAGTAIVLLWIHWPLGLFILLMNPVVIYLTMLLGRKVKRLKSRENKAYELFQEALSETLESIQQVRAANRESHYIGRIVSQADKVRQRSSAYTWKSDAATRLSFMVFLFGFDLFRAISRLMVVFSDLSIGQMLAVFAYLWFMMGPVQELLGIQYAYHSANAALARINTLIDLPREPHYPHQANPFRDKRTTAIRFEDICFAYGDGPPVLEHVSLTINEGEKVALVGASGGGKTTLVQILLGLYTPQQGTIYFDGIPASEIGNDIIRDNVATVLQHPALFNDSVRSNLTLGREAPDDALWHALEIAQLRDFVEAMEQGLDTRVGRHGVRLSGGQRQRLAVARMVLTEPRIVVLDEATSALDTRTEQHLHAALQEYLSGRTTLIIAHRLSAVRQADRALVFDSGRIIEDGTHEQLIESDGLYARLYGRQHP